MSSAHICQACRRRLAQVRPRNLPQWQQRACFISPSRSAPRTTTDDKGTGDISNLGDDVGKRQGRYATLPERKRSTPQYEGASPGDFLESLFEQSITDAGVAEKPAPHAISSLEPYKQVDTLKEMMKNSYPPADSFHFFVEQFGPEAGAGVLKSSLPSYIQQTAKVMLRTIITAKARAPFSNTLPSATEVSSVFRRLGLLQASEWVGLMVPLIRNLIILPDKKAQDLTREKNLLSDLLGAWNVVCRKPDDFEDLPEDSSSQLNWSRILPFSSNDAAQALRRHGPTVAFGILTPPFPTKHLGQLPPLVLSSYQLLKAKEAVVKSIPGDSSLFISALSRIISGTGFNIDSASAVGTDMVIAKFIKSLPAVKDLRSQGTNFEVEEPIPGQFVNPQLGYNKGISFINKRLHEALKSQNRHQVDELWSGVKQWPIAANEPPEDSLKSLRGTLSVPLCNYFILVYMSVRQPNRAIDVWNHMIQNKMTPTLSTWDSMMSGCKAARDHKALEDVWRKMRMARVQPDIFCWTTRISGLMDCHKVDAAVGALDEMGRTWIEAAQKQHPEMPLVKLQKIDGIKGATKPTIATVNAAIVGVLRQQRKDYAPKILAWAGNYGITPDVKTYNILLKPLLRAGQTQQAMNLLQQMRKVGIEADEGTYTTILDETFRFAADLSPEEQKETIFSVFDEMEQAGLKANLHTFGKIIYALLQDSTGDMAVVEIVLERMAKLNLEPSTHIYTTLVQHYFNQEPPQLDAVRSTIERASMGFGNTDLIFWDRIVEGYSRAGETAAALRIVGKVNSTDSRVGWLAMRELLIALTKNGEWDMAKALVRDKIIDTGGPLSPDAKGKEGQHRFWALARELDLLKNVGAGTAY